MQGVGLRRFRHPAPHEDDDAARRAVRHGGARSMIKKAFDANGIKFAYPTVQVAGGECGRCRRFHQRRSGAKGARARQAGRRRVARPGRAADESEPALCCFALAYGKFAEQIYTAASPNILQRRITLLINASRWRSGSSATPRLQGQRAVPDAHLVAWREVEPEMSGDRGQEDDRFLEREAGTDADAGPAPNGR